MHGADLPGLDQLTSFVEAASTLNVREASRRLHRSPAALTGRIQALEDQLGAVLFERSTRRVALTPAGRRLLPLAVQCLESARTAASAVRADTDEVELSVGTRFELGLSWLVPSLDARGEPSWPFRRIELLPDAPMVQDQLRLIWRTGHAKAPELVVLAAELSEIPLC